MKIMAIPAYNGNISTNHNKKSNPNYVNNNTNNSPSFKAFGIKTLTKYISNNRSKNTWAQREAVMNFLNDDIRILSKRTGKSEEQLKQTYGKDLEIGQNWRYRTDRKGLDSLIGYPMQKMKLMQEVVAPIIRKVTNKPSEIKVPNGVIINGNGIENEEAANALLEHLKGKDPKRIIQVNSFEKKEEPLMHSKVVEGNWKEGDTENNIEALCKPFELARVQHNLSGTHSTVLVKNVDDIFTSDNTEMLQLALRYQTQHAAEEGITWVVTTKKPEKLPEWLTKEHEPVTVEIGDIKSDFDKSLVLQDSILKTYRRDTTNHDEIFAYMRLRKFPERPSAINEVVQSAHEEMRKKDFNSIDYGNFETFYTDDVLKKEIDKYVSKK